MTSAQTTHPLIKSTNPNYATGSGLMLEVSYDGENWSKLRSAEPYSHNRQVSITKQIEQLEETRDGWVSRGPAKYRTAKFRIGGYKYFPELEGYAWQDARKEPITT